MCAGSLNHRPRSLSCSVGFSSTSKRAANNCQHKASLSNFAPASAISLRLMEPPSSLFSAPRYWNSKGRIEGLNPRAMTITIRSPGSADDRTAMRHILRMPQQFVNRIVLDTNSCLRPLSSSTTPRTVISTNVYLAKRRAARLLCSG
jgi:hypothetical protein